MTRPEFDAGEAQVLLCDADGNLFPSEVPAFEASTEVTNRLLAQLGIDRSFTAPELRRLAEGRNFRVTAVELAAGHGVTIPPEELERWVEEERRAVVAHLGDVLAPDAEVLGPLEAIAGRMRLALVSSSALERLDACLRATGLDEVFPPEARFSAEDSMPTPASKPDPAIYAFAGDALGVAGRAAIAVEDATAGVESAVAAGFPAIGNLVFVPPDEREERETALRAAGADAVVGSWWEIGELLGAEPGARAPVGTS